MDTQAVYDFFCKDAVRVDKTERFALVFVDEEIDDREPVFPIKQNLPCKHIME